MNENGPKRFDQILKKAEDDSQAFFSGAIILIVGFLRAAYTFPSGDSGDGFSWAWKVALFFGILGPFVIHIWKTARFAIFRSYREAGAFMSETLKGPAVKDMPFRHLWRMRDIAWAEHLSQLRASPAAGKEGFRQIQLMDASGEEILIHTRIKCARCGRTLDQWLAKHLWDEREASKSAFKAPQDLLAARRCIACGSERGQFTSSLAGPVEAGES